MTYRLGPNQRFLNTFAGLEERHYSDRAAQDIDAISRLGLIWVRPSEAVSWQERLRLPDLERRRRSLSCHRS
jgi:hypothetical protein